MRKRATEGTKIRTSPNITKKIVSTRRRADRLCNSTLSLASAQARQQADEPAGAWRKQGGRKKAAGNACRGFGHPDLGEFGIGEGDPGQCPVIDLGRKSKESVSDHNPRMIESDVGELRPAGHVADGKSPAIGGAQSSIDRDALGGC